MDGHANPTDITMDESAFVMTHYSVLTVTESSECTSKILRYGHSSVGNNSDGILSCQIEVQVELCSWARTGKTPANASPLGRINIMQAIQRCKACMMLVASKHDLQFQFSDCSTHGKMAQPDGSAMLQAYQTALGNKLVAKRVAMDWIVPLQQRLLDAINVAPYRLCFLADCLKALLFNSISSPLA